MADAGDCEAGPLIAIHDKNGERLPITWQGYDFNKQWDDSDTFDGGEQEGCFVDAVTHSTNINYASEVSTEITKSGGGIEYYNPRVTSRVVNIRARVQSRNYNKLHSHLNYIQQLFSPFYLQTAWNLWPPYAGRPLWTDPWSAFYKGLKFYTLEDGSYFPGMLDSSHYPSGEVPLQYSVAPLALPDPLIAAIGTGWGATLDMSWLILDGGIAIDTQSWYRTGNGTLIPEWSNIPTFPHISFDMTGVGHASLTVAISNDHPYFEDFTLVLHGDQLVNADHVDIYTRDRVIWVNGVVDNSLYSSGDYPVLAPYPYTNTIAWSNTTNLSNQTVTFMEALSA